MNKYDVDFEFARDDGSIYKSTLIAEAKSPEQAEAFVLSALGVIRSDIKVTAVRLRTSEG